MILAVGAAFAFTVTVILGGVTGLKPPLSVTVAVIVCTPTLSVPEPKISPDPITPSRLDNQLRFALRAPSYASLALPLKVMLLPSV